MLPKSTALVNRRSLGDSPPQPEPATTPDAPDNLTQPLGKLHPVRKTRRAQLLDELEKYVIDPGALAHRWPSQIQIGHSV